MTIQDVEYIQELEHRISELESNSCGNIDLFTIALLVITISLFVGSIVTMIIMFNCISKYGK